MHSALYPATVMHARFQPKRYRFTYRVFSLLLDIDELEMLDRTLRFFSLNRFNLFGFDVRDHGPANGNNLRHWALGLLTTRGIDLDGGRIAVLCFPRVLGYGFNPLSVWYCHHRDGSLRAVIYEVRNTFGEKHQYLACRDDGAPLQDGEIGEAGKVFHVSPFMSLDARYRFRLSAPGERIRVVIDEHDSCSGDRLLVATLAGKRAALTDAALLRCFFLMPLLTVKVVTMIHWQALKLWLRGIPFFRKPAPPAHEVTEACTTNPR